MANQNNYQEVTTTCPNCGSTSVVLTHEKRSSLAKGAAGYIAGRAVGGSSMGVAGGLLAGANGKDVLVGVCSNCQFKTRISVSEYQRIHRKVAKHNSKVHERLEEQSKQDQMRQAYIEDRDQRIAEYKATPEYQEMKSSEATWKKSFANSGGRDVIESELSKLDEILSMFEMELTERIVDSDGSKRFKRVALKKTKKLFREQKSKVVEARRYFKKHKSLRGRDLADSVYFRVKLLRPDHLSLHISVAIDVAAVNQPLKAFVLHRNTPMNKFSETNSFVSSATGKPTDSEVMKLTKRYDQQLKQWWT